MATRPDYEFTETDRYPGAKGPDIAIERGGCMGPASSAPSSNHDADVQYSPSVQRGLANAGNMTLAPPPPGCVYDVYHKPGGVGMFIGCKREDNPQVMAEMSRIKELGRTRAAVSGGVQLKPVSLARTSSIRNSPDPPRKRPCTHPQIPRVVAPHGVAPKRSGAGTPATEAPRSNGMHQYQAAQLSGDFNDGHFERNRRSVPPSPQSVAQARISNLSGINGPAMQGKAVKTATSAPAPTPFPLQQGMWSRYVAQQQAQTQDNSRAPRANSLAQSPAPHRSQTLDNAGNTSGRSYPMGSRGTSLRDQLKLTLRDQLKARVMNMDADPSSSRQTKSKPLQKAIPCWDQRQRASTHGGTPGTPSYPYGQQGSALVKQTTTRGSQPSRSDYPRKSPTPAPTSQAKSKATPAQSQRTMRSMASARSFRSLAQETDYNAMDSVTSTIDTGDTPGTRKRKRGQGRRRPKQAAGGTPKDRKDFHKIMLDQVKEWSRAYMKDGILPTYIRFKDLHKEAVTAFKDRLKATFPQCYKEDLVDYIMGNKFGGERRNGFRRSGARSTDYRTRISSNT